MHTCSLQLLAQLQLLPEASLRSAIRQVRVSSNRFSLRTDSQSQLE